MDRRQETVMGYAPEDFSRFLRQSLETPFPLGLIPSGDCDHFPTHANAADADVTDLRVPDDCVAPAPFRFPLDLECIHGGIDHPIDGFGRGRIAGQCKPLK